MSLYVQIVNGQVAQCINTIPPSPLGSDGWKEAVEVRPDIIPNRQGYTDYTWNLDTDPVQIVYGTFDIAVSDRQTSMVSQAQFVFQQVITQQAQNVSSGGTYDTNAIVAAQAKMTSDIAAIQACTTHDELDALVL